MPVETAVKRRLFAEALQHPAVLVPMVVFGLSIVYLLLLAPVIREGVWIIGVILIVAGIAAVFALLRRFTILNRAEFHKLVKEMKDLRDEERKRTDEEHAREMRDILQAGFSDIDCTEGLNTLTQLSREYEQLQAFIESGAHTDPIPATLVPELAADTYRQGLGVLSDSFELSRAARSSSERLNREIAELKEEIRTIKGDGSQTRHLKIKEETLESHVQRLSLLDQIQFRVEQLLFQAGRCEALLHRTRLELVTIRTGNSETSVDSVIEALQGTLCQVAEAQEELRILGV